MADLLQRPGLQAVKPAAIPDLHPSPPDMPQHSLLCLFNLYPTFGPRTQGRLQSIRVDLEKNGRDESLVYPWSLDAFLSGANGFYNGIADHFQEVVVESFARDKTPQLCPFGYCREIVN